MPNILPTSFVVCTIGLQVLSHRIHLHLRQLLRHFHSLGLTSRFTPPCQSDQSVLTNLLRPWRDLSFLTSAIPNPLSRRSSWTPLCTAGVPIWGVARFQVLGPIQTTNSISTVWNSKPYFWPSITGPQCYESYGQYHSSVLYPQTGWE